MVVAQLEKLLILWRCSSDEIY